MNRSMMKSLVVLLALLGVCAAEVVHNKECSVNDCDIAELRVNPCTRDNPSGPCLLRRGKPATLELDFTPNFDADSLAASVVWVTDSGAELPFVGMDDEACKYTTCPVKSGVKQTYSVEIPISRKFPIGFYPLKWTLKAPSGKQCCFQHEIKLTR